jgi:hypothetical protein
MTSQDAIKSAPDVVQIHHYEDGHLVATEYKSSLGTVLERHSDQNVQAEALYTEDGAKNVAPDDKPKRR